MISKLNKINFLLKKHVCVQFIFYIKSCYSYQTLSFTKLKGHLTKKNWPKEWTIRTGDIINIHDKQEDGWWLGELKGQVGIFPAKYVEDIIPK